MLGCSSETLERVASEVYKVTQIPELIEYLDSYVVSTEPGIANPAHVDCTSCGSASFMFVSIGHASVDGFWQRDRDSEVQLNPLDIYHWCAEDDVLPLPAARLEMRIDFVQFVQPLSQAYVSFIPGA